MAYFFVANGKFLAGPNDVRLKGFDLRDKHSYYCKVQVTVGVQDQELAAERIESLLTELMPEINGLPAGLERRYRGPMARRCTRRRPCRDG